MGKVNPLENKNKFTNSTTDNIEEQNCVSRDPESVDRFPSTTPILEKPSYTVDSNLAHTQRNIVCGTQPPPKVLRSPHVLYSNTPKDSKIGCTNLSLDSQKLKNSNLTKKIPDPSEGRNQNPISGTNGVTSGIKRHLSKEKLNGSKVSPQRVIHAQNQGVLTQISQESLAPPKRSAAKVSFRNQKGDFNPHKDCECCQSLTLHEGLVSLGSPENYFSYHPSISPIMRDGNIVPCSTGVTLYPTNKGVHVAQGLNSGIPKNDPSSTNILRSSPQIPDRTYNTNLQTSNQKHQSKGEVLSNTMKEPNQNDLNTLKKPHDWLQNPILFYLSENLIKLHELRTKYKQSQALGGASPALKARGASFLSLDSGFSREYREQLETLKRYITYSVSEIEGILLNPLFTLWSEKYLRNLLKKVTSSWRNGGLDSKEFEEASFLLLKTISEERSGTINHTPIYRLREYFGGVQHYSTGFYMLSIVSSIAFVATVFLAVFGSQHYAIRIALAIILWIAIFLIFCFSFLVLNHNSSVDATAGFFKMEILFLSNDTTSSDQEDSFSLLENLTPRFASPCLETILTPCGESKLANEKIKMAHTIESNATEADGKKSQQSEIPFRSYASERQRHPKDQPQRTLSKIIKTDTPAQDLLTSSEYLLGAEIAGKNGYSNSLGDAKGGCTTVNSTFIIDLADSISITALIYCNDEYVLSMLMSSLWEFNFLVLRSDIPQIDSIYQQGSDKYKIIILHAPDLLEGTAEGDMVLSWINEKLPVFFISCGNYGFPSFVLSSKKLQTPLTEENIASLILSGTGKDGRLNSARMGYSYTSLKAPPYTLGRRLGGGAYGNVFEAEMEESGVMCAVKRIYLKNSNDDTDQDGKNYINQLRDIAREVEIMSSLTHPNVVQYLFCERDDNCISIFMELCLGGSLSRLINSGEILDPDFIKQVLRDIVSAVAYLHRKKVTHRDLKPDNVLFTNRRAKLTDFGTAILKRNRENLSPVTGTFAYMAPEIILCEVYGNACDMWSIGCIAAEILKVDLPHRSLGLPGMCEFYRKMDMNSSLEIDCYVAEVRDFLRSCLQRNPNSRSTARELLHHDCLKHNNSALDKWMKSVLSKKCQSRPHTAVALNLFNPNTTISISNSQTNMLSLKSFENSPNP